MPLHGCISSAEEQEIAVRMTGGIIPCRVCWNGPALPAALPLEQLLDLNLVQPSAKIESGHSR